MRYFMGLVCVLALGAMPMVGCTDDGGGGGSGGIGGDGGMGGSNSAVFPCTEQGIVDAIAEGGGPHTFSCDGPQTVVTEAEIVIDNDVILDGESQLTVDAGGIHVDPLDDHRVFSVTTGVTTELRAMTVTRGWAQDAGPVNGIEGPGAPTHRTFGGGIVSIGTLTLRDTTVSQNSADAGGGIHSEGTLMLTGSTVSENDAQSGAGIVNGGSGTMTLANSTVSRNWAATFGWGLGAGIYNEGEMSIIHSTISENHGSHAPGGGIYNAASGTLSLIKSTVSKNDASADGPGHGGGIYNDGEMTIMNSTVSENRVAGLHGGFGGGIYSSGWTSLTNTTVSSNTADSADAIYVGSVGYLEVARTVIHGDCDKDAEDGSNVTWVSLGYNIESPGAGGAGGSGSGDTCGFDTNKGDQVSVSPDDLKLGPLQDNGGPTETHALLPRSVAIDVIPQAECLDADGQPLITDQRGQPRPETGGTMCDVGSFERQPTDSN